MNKKSNRVPSAGTKAEKSTKDETRLPSSPTIGNTHVVRSPKSASLVECQNKISVVDDNGGKWFFVNAPKGGLVIEGERSWVKKRSI